MELSGPSVHAFNNPSKFRGCQTSVLIHKSQDVRNIAPVMDRTMLDTESVVETEHSAPIHTDRERKSRTVRAPARFCWRESDTNSLPETDAVQEEPVEESTVDFTVHQRATHAAFQLWDDCELGTVFESRAQTMKTVPFFLKYAFKQLCASLWKKSCPGGTIVMR